MMTALQVFPHEPQLFESLKRFVQAPLQTAPPGQVRGETVYEQSASFPVPTHAWQLPPLQSGRPAGQSAAVAHWNVQAVLKVVPVSAIASPAAHAESHSVAVAVLCQHVPLGP
jgi:hypothetical protein